MNLTVDPVNDAPVANTDSGATNTNVAVTLSVLANDSDIDIGDVLSISGIVANPTNGMAVLSGTTQIVYTPNPGYTGSDSFTYEAQDQLGLVSNTVTVTVTTTTLNTAPVALTTSSTGSEDTPQVFSLSGTDADMDTLTFALATPATSGTASISSTGLVTYTPNANYNGSDSFTFTVNDGTVDSPAVTVNLTVDPVNDLPSAMTGASYTTTGNTLSNSGYTLMGTLTGSDIETSMLTFTASVLPTHGTLTLSNTGVFTYLPTLGYTGPDSFYFMVNDGTVNSTASIVNICVGTCIMTPPVIVVPVNTNIVGAGGGGGGSSASSVNGSSSSIVGLSLQNMLLPSLTFIKTATASTAVANFFTNVPLNKQSTPLLRKNIQVFFNTLIANDTLSREQKLDHLNALNTEIRIQFTNKSLGSSNRKSLYHALRLIQIKKIMINRSIDE